MHATLIEALVDASAAAQGLDIAPEHRPGVLFYFGLAASFAEQIAGHTFSPADEPAIVFVPVAPERSEDQRS